MLMALPLLPSQTIEIGFNNIVDYFNELIGPIPIDDPNSEYRQDLQNHGAQIIQFFNYYGRFWITGIQLQILTLTIINKL